MKLPRVNVPSLTQQVVNIFRGLDRRPETEEGAWFQTENLTAENFPVLSTRALRGWGETVENPGGLIAKDALAVVDGSRIVYNGYPIELGLTEGVKQLVSMGAYLLIWPDKKWLNTAQLGEYGGMENAVEAEGPVTATLCRQDGTEYEGITIAETAPAEAEDGALWMDISGKTPGLYQYSDATGAWSGIATVYVRLSCAGIGAGFSAYDGVTISGFTGAAIPVCLYRCGVDPAVASGPLITTVNDLVAVVSYYGLAFALLLNL